MSILDTDYDVQADTHVEHYVHLNELAEITIDRIKAKYDMAMNDPRRQKYDKIPKTTASKKSRKHTAHWSGNFNIRSYNTIIKYKDENGEDQAIVWKRDYTGTMWESRVANLKQFLHEWESKYNYYITDVYTK